MSNYTTLKTLFIALNGSLPYEYDEKYVDAGPSIAITMEAPTTPSTSPQTHPTTTASSTQAYTTTMTRSKSTNGTPTTQTSTS